MFPSTLNNRITVCLKCKSGSLEVSHMLLEFKTFKKVISSISFN